jgi:hypothetical protein
VDVFVTTSASVAGGAEAVAGAGAGGFAAGFGAVDFSGVTRDWLVVVVPPKSGQTWNQSFREFCPDQ